MSPAERLLLRRALRSVSAMVIFTAGAIVSIHGSISRPRGSPLLYAIALSWLIAIVLALPASAFFRAYPKLLPLARWENGGEVYDRPSIRAFRWLLLHSPLGWINPNLHVSTRRTDWDRLLREMAGAEGVHWTTCLLASVLGISYVYRGYSVYGYAMLLVRIPFDAYPVMLLRRNRARVRRLLRRTEPRPSW